MKLLPVGLIVILSAVAGCGKHPTVLYSAQDIRRATKDTERVRIGFLPISDYPMLSKFERLKDIDFFTLNGTGANDDKLAALAKLRLDRLEGISLLNCPAVTDRGIRHLSGLPSLRHMQLEGTSITDDALETIASKMTLTGLNVANCPKVTMEGLLKMVSSETLVTFTFSADAMEQEDVARLIREFRHVQWPSVIDREGKLDVAPLEMLAKQKGAALNVSRTGALQDVMK